MLKLVKRHNGTKWYIRGTIRGQSVDESTGTSDRRAAEEIRIKRQAELLEQSIHGARVTIKFSQAALSYLEHGGDRRYMERLLLHFGGMKLAEINQASMDRAAKVLYPDCLGSTINRQLYTPVCSVLTHAARRGWCDKPVYDRPKEPDTRVRWITKDEAAKLLDACAPHLRPLVMFLLYTGARVGEALFLTWKDVDLARNHVQFLNTKNGTSRGVPIHSRLAVVLNGVYRSMSPFRDGIDHDKPIFRTHYGTPYRAIESDSLTDLSAGSRIKTAFRAAVSRAGLSDFRPHDCRHTWATWHYQANRDLGALQKLGGWKTLSMVLRYAHTNVEEHAATIERL